MLLAKGKNPKKILSLIFLSLYCLTLVSVPVFAQAAAFDIPCTPSNAPITEPASGTSNNSDLFDCVNQLYKYALIISSIAAVFMIIIAGYMYIFSGGDSGKVSSAKSFITTSLLGIAVLLTGFLLLKQINPELLSIKNITPQQIGMVPWERVGGDGENDDPSGAVTGPVTLPTGSAKSLAAQILAKHPSSVALASVHGSSPNSGDTALQNIRDTADGKCAKTKQDPRINPSCVGLSETMLGAILAISERYKINISEIAGGGHCIAGNSGCSGTSRHYAGVGFDINVINGTHVGPNDGNSFAVMQLCLTLGATEVIGPNPLPSGARNNSAHNNHIHCGWPR